MLAEKSPEDLSDEERAALKGGGSPTSYKVLVALLALQTALAFALPFVNPEGHDTNQVVIVGNCALLFLSFVLHPAVWIGLMVAFVVRLGYIPYLIHQNPGRFRELDLALGMAAVVVYHIVVILLLIVPKVRRHFWQRGPWKD